MIIRLLIFTIIVVSISASSIPKTLENIPEAINNTKLNTQLQLSTKKTNFTGVSEGGSIAVTLPKENHTILLNLDKELVKNKEKSVLPRKGVKYVPQEDEIVNHSIGDNQEIIKTNIGNASLITTSITQNTNVKNDKLNITRPHKPQVLSAEILENLGPDVKDDPIPKIQKLDKNSHPDIIMPIVITILVVPMFAVVGYMAIKRGQEAWKNRHYKRMDFLLDGMYND